MYSSKEVEEPRITLSAVQVDGVRVELSTTAEATMDDLFNLFRQFSLALGYYPGTVAEFFDPPSESARVEPFNYNPGGILAQANLESDYPPYPINSGAEPFEIASNRDSRLAQANLESECPF